MLRSAAVLARCSKVVRRVRKTKAAAQIVPRYVNFIVESQVYSKSGG